MPDRPDTSVFFVFEPSAALYASFSALALGLFDAIVRLTRLLRSISLRL